MDRRYFLQLTALAASAPPALSLASQAMAQKIDTNAILNDPETPTSGNPKGDVTIVAFFDYNCPYCKQAAPDLERVVKEDGNIRLVYKDWPILTEASVYGAQVALAAKYQGAYDKVHHALMGIPGKRISQDTMREAVQKSGVDLKRLQTDVDTHGKSILALLKRTAAQADSLGLAGTPVYLIGPFKTPTLDYDGFKRAVAEARARQAKK
jgi:protein-disulfide isomerase